MTKFVLPISPLRRPATVSDQSIGPKTKLGPVPPEATRGSTAYLSDPAGFARAVKERSKTDPELWFQGLALYAEDLAKQAERLPVARTASASPVPVPQAIFDAQRLGAREISTLLPAEARKTPLAKEEAQSKLEALKNEVERLFSSGEISSPSPGVASALYRAALAVGIPVGRIRVGTSAEDVSERLLQAA